jgi:ankyrin repeat protein
LAIREKKPMITQLFVERGANLDAANKVVLHHFLTLPPARLVERGPSPLPQVSLLQEVEVDYSKIRAGSLVITVNLQPYSLSLTLRTLQFGNTPLLSAIHIGDTSIAQLLVERGANVDAANKVVFITTPISGALFVRVLELLK